MYRYLASAFIAFAIIGCGGSSDPGSDTKTKITGVAVDDLIVNGIVNVYPFGNKSQTLATGRTDNDDGTYDLNISYNGVVTVEVTCDSFSRMLNPASMVRSECASNLQLHSVASVTSDTGSLKVNVSPLTEAVVQRVNELGATPQNLQKANEEIKIMFGADPLGDDPTKGEYSEIIGAFHIAARDANMSVTEVINDVAQDLKDGEAGDSDTTKKLAQAMQEKEISNNIADNGGIFNPGELPINQEEIENKKFYIVADAEFGTLDFNQTHMEWRSLFNENEFDISSYVIEDGKIKSNGEVIERVVKTDKYFILKNNSENQKFYLFENLSDAKAKVIEMSANFTETVTDPQNDSKGKNPGFELTSLVTTIKDNNLIITVRAKGSIKNAIDSVTPTQDYSNILWIEINKEFEFGLMKDGSYLSKIRFDEEGAFIGDAGALVENYILKILNDGVELSIPLTELGDYGEILSIVAEVAEDYDGEAEDETKDQNSFDEIRTFVTVKSVPLNAADFSNKTFYSSWEENGNTIYVEFNTTDQNITVTEQSGNMLNVEKGTYEIVNGSVVATVEGKEHNLTLIDQTLAYLMILVKDIDSINIEKWYRQKPVGYPGFFFGDGNHAPEIGLRFPPITLNGVSVDMLKVVAPFDADNDPLTMGIVKKPIHGGLKINDVIVENNYTISIDEITSVVYYSPTDFNGTDSMEINMTDGMETVNRVIEVKVLDENNTLAISADDLNGMTFYTSWEENADMVFAKLDVNSTDVTIHKNVNDVNSTLYSPYEILKSKILKVEDMQMYLLFKNDKLWKFATLYDTNEDGIYGNEGDESEIEVWYLQKPEYFPSFDQ